MESSVPVRNKLPQKSIPDTEETKDIRRLGLMCSLGALRFFCSSFRLLVQILETTNDLPVGRHSVYVQVTATVQFLIDVLIVVVAAGK